MRGKYILLEGGECAGKSTHIKLIIEKLKSLNINAILTREPGSPHINFNVRDLLLDASKEIDPIARELLFQADRAEHSSFIKKKLDEGTWVISDRGFVSGLAYAMSHKHDLKYLGKVVKWANKVFPDIIFYLKISPELSLMRQESRGQIKTYEESKGLEHLIKIEKNFEIVLNKLKNPYWRFLGLPKIKSVWLNSENSVEDVHNSIFTVIKCMLGEK